MENGEKNKWNGRDGGYVFISHSHKDIAEVRKLRNRLEENGFEPLCFYLKCLTDKDEVDGLIKREIDAREWFVYVDSPNARDSEWVRKEREYINQIGTKKVLTFSLDESNSIEAQADRIMKSMRVFLSYSHRDAELAGRIRDELLRRDLQVFWDQELRMGDFVQQLTEQLREAAENGCLLFLVTENTMRSEWALRELEKFYQLSGGRNVVPVIVGDVNFSDSVLPFYLNVFQHISIGAEPEEEELRKVAELVEKVLVGRF